MVDRLLSGLELVASAAVGASGGALLAYSLGGDWAAVGIGASLGVLLVYAVERALR